MTPSIIDQLGVNPQTAGQVGNITAGNTAPSVTPGAGPTKAEEAAGGASKSPLKDFPILDKIVSGKIPGVLVPKDFPAKQGGLTPDALSDAGIGIYKPHTADFAGLLFNPKVVSVDHLVKLDQAGELPKYFPSLGDMFGTNSAGKDKPEGTPSTPEDAGAQNMVGGEPNPGGTGPVQTVPILPKPTFGAAAQKKALTSRLAAVADQTEPSARPVPGGGSILNSLMQRAR